MSEIQSNIGRSADLLYYLLGYENEKTAKSATTSVPKPDFTQFDCCTKSAPAMSEDEYKKAIIELAKKDAASGDFGGENSGAYRELKKSFVSVASPDRKSIISANMRSFFTKEKVTFAEFKDGAGNIIAHYSSNNGWTMIATRSEIARESEFDAIYNEAWKSAYSNQGCTADSSNIGSSFSTYA